MKIAFDHAEEMKKHLKENSLKHMEAFAVMSYQCQKCGTKEKIWNSRDGVTPLCIDCPTCAKVERGTMFHIEWEKDLYAPNYIPKIGQRLFFSFRSDQEIVQHILDTDFKKEIESLEYKLLNYIEVCEWIDSNIVATIASQDVSIEEKQSIYQEKFIGRILKDPYRFEQPHIITVTEDNINRFLSSEAKRELEIRQKKLALQEDIKAFNTFVSEKMNVEGPLIEVGPDFQVSIAMPLGKKQMLKRHKSETHQNEDD